MTFIKMLKSWPLKKMHDDLLFRAQRASLMWEDCCDLSRLLKNDSGVSSIRVRKACKILLALKTVEEAECCVVTQILRGAKRRSVFPVVSPERNRIHVFSCEWKTQF